MKISDPIGKVYQHSMFKKKSYSIPPGGDGGHKSGSDEDDDVSDVSDQSDDSLSTKSSRIVSSRRARSSSRRRQGRSEEESGERDREDAISYASRHERGNRSSSRKSSRKPSTKKYGLDNLGPPGTSYSLWTSQKSLKRDHKRKFNRSMCGVLLGVSIVLVILGILGIIGIAVYLGVVQKTDPDKDLVSLDGAIRVVSEEFSLSLLNPSSLDYKKQEEKFTNILQKTFRKSNLKDALVKVVIDGFSSGSIKVFFKIILDKEKLPGRTKEDPVLATKDVLVQEVMSLDRSEFQDTIIDIDSIDFQLSKVQDVAKKYLEPEPYQGEQPASTQSGSEAAGSLWQNLAQSTARSIPRQESFDESSLNTQNWPPSSSATERQDSFNGETPLNANGWSLPRYPEHILSGHKNNLVPAGRYPNSANVVTPQSPVIINRSPTPGLSSFPGSPLSPVSPSYPPSLNNQRLDISSRRGPATSNDLMSEYLEPPPPPPPSSEPSLKSLESLFRGPAMSPSEVNFKLTPRPPQPQTQNRRIDQASETVENYSDKYNGFWNMLHPDKKKTQQSSYEKVDRKLNIDNDLEQLLMMESPSLYQQIQMMDDNEIKQLADQLVPLLEPQANQNNFNNNPWRNKPRKDPVSINNFGSSGLKSIKTNNNVIRGSTTSPRSTTVMDIHVPQDQDTGFFGVGSSLSFAGDSSNTMMKSKSNNVRNTFMNSVGSLNSDQLISHKSLPLGSDPNIVYPQQIRAGTQMMQGPQGPIVSSPRPQNLAVAQTPLAPQIPNPEDTRGTIITRDPPGHYHAATSSVSGHKMSPASDQISSSQLLAALSPPRTRPVTSGVSSRRNSHSAQQTGGTDRQGSDIIGNILPAAIGLSSSAGISPIGIFSNLLNAYATIDSKHDLTGKIINSAANWLQPPTAEVRTTDVVETTTSATTTATSSSPSSKSSVRQKSEETTRRTGERPVTNISVRVHDKISSDENQYQSVFDKIRAAAQESEYHVVTDSPLPPVKSNLFSGGPLRPKPPSEEIIQVSPAPHDYDQDKPPIQYGVSNPQWYSNEIQASTAGYGPDDFIVETVNLDKNFFYQFFTSKPMIIDTDVVTSTSVKVKYDAKPKKGRDTDMTLFKSSRETLQNLPEHLVGRDILPNHILKKMGEAYVDDERDQVTENDPAAELIVNKSKFKRYHLPPEVQITHGRRKRKQIEGEEESSDEESESERVLSDSDHMTDNVSGRSN